MRVYKHTSVILCVNYCLTTNFESEQVRASARREIRSNCCVWGDKRAISDENKVNRSGKTRKNMRKTRKNIRGVVVEPATNRSSKRSKASTYGEVDEKKEAGE